MTSKNSPSQWPLPDQPWAPPPSGLPWPFTWPRPDLGDTNGRSGHQPPALRPPIYIIEAMYQRPDIRAAVAALAPVIATELASNLAAVQTINDLAGRALLSTDDAVDERLGPAAAAILVVLAGLAVGGAIGAWSRPTRPE
jgi:hypothetical protein